MSSRVTKVRCLACNSKGEAWPAKRCPWCDGTKKAAIGKALMYADVLWLFEHGQLAVPEKTFNNMNDRKRRALYIAALCGDPDRYSEKMI
jgi:hypothetical protein